MLPFLISKTKLLQIKNKKSKEKNQSEKSSYRSDDNLGSKVKRVRRKPLIIPPIILTTPCDCALMHVSRIIINYAPKNRKRGASNIVLSMRTWGATGQQKRMKLPTVTLIKKYIKKEEIVTYDSDDFFKKLENQLKALNLGKANKIKKGETPASQRSKSEKEGDGSESMPLADDGGSGEVRRRGKRRRKGRSGVSDRLTSAGLAAQAQQDPETQVAGIGTDSQNPSSRGSIAPTVDEDMILPVLKTSDGKKKTDSFLDDDILKYLHREVDEEAIETEFDTKRRYVLREALRTRPPRTAGRAVALALRELRVAPPSLADWLHVPRVFSRQSATFGLPIDSSALETLTPMDYAARFVTLKKSKQLLYLTVLRKFIPKGYRMPIKHIEEGLRLMMGGILTAEQVKQFQSVMEWDQYEDDENIPDEIKVTLLDTERVKHSPESGDTVEPEINTIKYRTWCGLCAICERMYGRFPPREKDPPDGMELSDFTMIETRIAALKVDSGLIEILNTIRTR